MATQNKVDLAVVESELKAFVERLPSTKSAFERNPSRLISIVDKAITRGEAALNDWSGQQLTLEGELLVGGIEEHLKVAKKERSDLDFRKPTPPLPVMSDPTPFNSNSSQLAQSSGGIMSGVSSGPSMSSTAAASASASASTSPSPSSSVAASASAFASASASSSSVASLSPSPSSEASISSRSSSPHNGGGVGIVTPQNGESPKVQVKIKLTYACGTKVRKDFSGKPFAGEVRSYNPTTKYYKIKYEDDDEEELDAEEVKNYLVGEAEILGEISEGMLKEESKDETETNTASVPLPEPIRVKLEYVQKAEDAPLVKSADTLRQEVLRAKLQTTPAGLPRAVFRAGCHSRCLTQVLGGVGTDDFRRVNEDKILKDGHVLIRKGEFYLWGLADWNPWAPSFAGDSGLYMFWDLASELREAGQKYFHIFRHCTDNRLKMPPSAWHGKDAAKKALYLGMYTVDDDCTQEMSYKDLAPVYTATQDLMCDWELRHGDGSRGTSIEEIRKHFERENRTYTMEVVVPVGYDERLYEELVRIGANNGVVSTDVNELGRL